MAADIKFGSITNRHNFNFGSTQVTAIDFGSTNIWRNTLYITGFTVNTSSPISNTARSVSMTVTGETGAIFEIRASGGDNSVTNYIIGDTLSGYTTITSGTAFNYGITSNNDPGDPDRSITFTLTGLTVSGHPPVDTSGITRAIARTQTGRPLPAYPYDGDSALPFTRTHNTRGIGTEYRWGAGDILAGTTITISIPNSPTGALSQVELRAFGDNTGISRGQNSVSQTYENAQSSPTITVNMNDRVGHSAGFTVTATVTFTHANYRATSFSLMRVTYPER